MHVYLSVLQNMIKQRLVLLFFQKRKCSSEIATIQIIRECL